MTFLEKQINLKHQKAKKGFQKSETQLMYKQDEDEKMIN